MIVGAELLLRFLSPLICLNDFVIACHSDPHCQELSYVRIYWGKRVKSRAEEIPGGGLAVKLRKEMFAK